MIKLLDYGNIKLTDTLPLHYLDLAVVESARVSYGGKSKGKLQDIKLLNYLMKHQHGTPFEMVNFKFYVKCPIFVARQWFRHRIGSFNEISARYSKMQMDFYIPDEWREQGKKNKQGSDGIIKDDLDIKTNYGLAISVAVDCYKTMLKRGVSKEMARIILPTSLYTEFYWSVNARSLMNFLKLRMAEDAQYEIRVYANAIYDIFSELMPETAKAFKNVR